MSENKEYETLQKKYKLPAFEELDNEFEISNGDETPFILRDIRSRMNDKITNFAKILSDILHPNNALADICEFKAFYTDEKAKLFKTYRKLMLLDRHSLELYIDPNEKADADFINDVFKDWPEIKKEIKDVVSKLQELWEKETESKEDICYLG